MKSYFSAVAAVTLGLAGSWALAQAPGHLRLSRLAVANVERQATELEVEALFTAAEPTEAAGVAR